MVRYVCGGVLKVAREIWRDLDREYGSLLVFILCAGFVAQSYACLKDMLIIWVCLRRDSDGGTPPAIKVHTEARIGEHRSCIAMPKCYLETGDWRADMRHARPVSGRLSSWDNPHSDI